MKINEIYKSIQGESSHAGRPCIFIRTSGCNLRCGWCDTPHAFHEGQEMSLEDVLEQVEKFEIDLVELTGGEPLLQQEAPRLISALLDGGHTVLVETSGSLDIRPVDPRAIIVMDIKCPGSGMSEVMRWDNISALKTEDQVKFVINNRADYEWAAGILKTYPTLKQHVVLFSPVFGSMDPRLLAEWILEDGLSVRLQLQIHKYIWHPEARGV